VIRNVLEGIGGHIAAFPIISLVIFVSFFVGVILWALSLSRRHVDHMSHLPLEAEAPSLERAAMSEKPDAMHGHEVDGISELDNLLPRWWVWLFALTSIFAVLYMLYYHVLDRGPLQAAMYQQEVAQAQGAIAAVAATSRPPPPSRRSRRTPSCRCGRAGPRQGAVHRQLRGLPPGPDGGG
jgi:cbb3-type cytochrome oxidase subunit 3